MSRSLRPFCPWCFRDDHPLPALRRHVKYCKQSPRPRDMVERKRLRGSR